MKSRSRQLADHSISSALSAIEIYNKPDFRDREQIFSVLMTMAWETLLKARCLQSNQNRMTSLYVKDASGHFKRNRNHTPFTIDIYEALRRCNPDPNVAANISHLVEIRDAAVHLTAASPTLPYLVFTLGTASLRNYARLLREWFDVSLSQYHFYILPLAFASPFKTLRMADFKREPDEVKAVIRAVAADQQSLPESKDFFFICEVATTFVSAKKITATTDLVAAVDPTNPDDIVVQRNVNPLDLYPLSAAQLQSEVRNACPAVKQNAVWGAIKSMKIKGDSRYSKFSYRTKSDETAGPTKATGVIYNHDAVRVLTEHFQKQGKMAG